MRRLSWESCCAEEPGNGPRGFGLAFGVPPGSCAQRRLLWSALPYSGVLNLVDAGQHPHMAVQRNRPLDYRKSQRDSYKYFDGRGDSMGLLEGYELIFMRVA